MDSAKAVFFCSRDKEKLVGVGAIGMIGISEKRVKINKYIEERDNSVTENSLAMVNFFGILHNDEMNLVYENLDHKIIVTSTKSAYEFSFLELRPIEECEQYTYTRGTLVAQRTTTPKYVNIGSKIDGTFHSMVRTTCFKDSTFQQFILTISLSRELAKYDYISEELYGKYYPCVLDEYLGVCLDISTLL